MPVIIFQCHFGRLESEIEKYWYFPRIEGSNTHGFPFIILLHVIIFMIDFQALVVLMTRLKKSICPKMTLLNLLNVRFEIIQKRTKKFVTDIADI